MEDGMTEILARYILPVLTDALLVPVLLCLLGLVLEYVGKLVTSFAALFLGRELAWLVVNRVLFIGTVHHELAHALFAFLTGAKVVRIVPIRFHGSELGEVDIRPRGNVFFRSLQQGMTAIAPVVCGCFSLALIWFYLLPVCGEVWQKILVYILGGSIFLHMNMSGQDVKVAVKGLPGCVLILFFLFLFIGFSLERTVLTLFPEFCHKIGLIPSQ